VIRYGSLFSGVGCWDYGLELAGGFAPAFFAEIVPFRRRVLAARWPGVPCFADVAEVTRARAPDVDALIGGFVCRDVSTANIAQPRGLARRSQSTWELYLHAIEQLTPRIIVVENVAKDGAWRRWVPPVRRALHERGYASVCVYVSSAMLGAAHHRERCFVFADSHREGESLRAVHAEVASLREVSRAVWCEPPTASGVREADGPSRWVERARAIGDGVDVRVARWTGGVVRAMMGIPSN